LPPARLADEHLEARVLALPVIEVRLARRLWELGRCELKRALLYAVWALALENARLRRKLRRARSNT
jgi:hypothetical protein